MGAAARAGACPRARARNRHPSQSGVEHRRFANRASAWNCLRRGLARDTDQPGSLLYRDAEGTGALTVMLLAVRPAYSIADKSWLLSDYMQHRAKFERGQRPSLEQSDPMSRQLEDSIEGSWSAADVVSGRRQLHRVLLTGGILADFCSRTSHKTKQPSPSVPGASSTARQLSSRSAASLRNDVPDRREGDCDGPER